MSRHILFVSDTIFIKSVALAHLGERQTEAIRLGGKLRFATKTSGGTGKLYTNRSIIGSKLTSLVFDPQKRHSSFCPFCVLMVDVVLVFGSLRSPGRGKSAAEGLGNHQQGRCAERAEWMTCTSLDCSPAFPYAGSLLTVNHVTQMRGLLHCLTAYGSLLHLI